MLMALSGVFVTKSMEIWLTSSMRAASPKRTLKLDHHRIRTKIWTGICR